MPRIAHNHTERSALDRTGGDALDAALPRVGRIREGNDLVAIERADLLATGGVHEACLFAMLDLLPFGGSALMVVATVLVATYYVTSLDSGTYALSEFVSAPRKSSPAFRVVLVASIATVAIVLLSLGDNAVVDTVQTGVIIGAFPFAFVILLMRSGRGPRGAASQKFLRDDACLRDAALLMARLVAALAQLVEHIIRNDGVRCSSHLSGTSFFKSAEHFRTSLKWKICLL